MRVWGQQTPQNPSAQSPAGPWGLVPCPQPGGPRALLRHDPDISVAAPSAGCCPAWGPGTGPGTVAITSPSPIRQPHTFPLPCGAHPEENRR